MSVFLCLSISSFQIRLKKSLIKLNFLLEIYFLLIERPSYAEGGGWRDRENGFVSFMAAAFGLGRSQEPGVSSGPPGCRAQVAGHLEAFSTYIHRELDWKWRNWTQT